MSIENFIKLNNIHDYCNLCIEKRENILQKILSASKNMLSLNEFIRTGEIELPDMFSLNNIKCYNDDIPILIEKNLITAFGYKGVLRKQKESLLKLAKSQNLPIIMLTNSEYENFIKSDVYNIYPKLIKSTGNGRTLHVLIMPRDLKKLMMTVNTAQGSEMRENYIRIEDLLKLYLEYQCMFYNVSYYKTIEDINNMKQNIQLRRMQNINILDNSIENKYKIGVIYFISDGEFTKIGYTYNLLQRLKELQTGNAKKLTVLKYYFTQFPNAEESALHALYSEYKVRGEWFKFPNFEDLFQANNNTLQF